ATVSAFADAWLPRSVVLVEASDLARAADLAPMATKGRGAALTREALTRADDLVGRLLERVDPTRDAVVVVAPAPSASGDSLTLAALRAPGVEPGFLRSASTRRDGFVLLADVAPTVVELAGLPADRHMSGSPFVARSTRKDAQRRRAMLVDASKAARFRDLERGPVTVTFTVMQGLLALATFLALGRPSPRRARRAIRFCALAVLGFVPAVYVARLGEFQNHGVFGYWLALVVSSFALGAAYQLLGRRGAA